MPSSFIADTYTPLTRHTFEAALKSAELALKAADEILLSRATQVYALCRPPGHHAEHASMMGYCYFNNAALLADKLSAEGKVAILDIDYHHGNGTQNLFYERDDVQYVSVHADPKNAFPYGTGYAEELGKGHGVGYNFNFPLAQETTTEEYLSTLSLAIDKVNEYQPAFVVISLGFDTYEDDRLPIGGLGINEQTYTTIGALLADKLTRPTFIVQEGGYNVSKLDVLAERFLDGYITA